MSIHANPVRGTRDILPKEMELRDQLQEKILSLYRSHGFERIETPILEDLNLLMNSDGGENLNMLFTILKRGEKLKVHEDSNVKDLCDTGLRYDLTLPLSRFYANNKNELQYPFKAIQIDNVFRAERPQKGRYRSFKQCDIDIIGEAGYVAEIELIHTTAKALREIGFVDFVVHINDRRILSNLITSAGFQSSEVSSISIVLDKMDKIGVEGVVTELVEKGYDEKGVSDIVESFATLDEEHLGQLQIDEEVKHAILQVIDTTRELSMGQYKIQFDPTLVRGMGYYTGQIFEITYGPYGFSIAGGGRYDHMIGSITKESIPAVGFSIGFERIVNILMNEENISRENCKKVALLYGAHENFAEVMKKAEAFRKQGYSVNTLQAKNKMNKQINALKDHQYNYIFVYGRDEELRTI